jgi:Amt family ammonium transporter
MAMGERTRFAPMCVVSVVMAGMIVPIVGYWAWRGWLARLGFIDLCGASIVHLTGAICAGVGAAIVGPRTGKYNRDGSANMIPGHSMPLASAGVLVMLVGWVPYGTGMFTTSFVPVEPLNILLAASAGGVVSLIFGNLRYGKPDVMLFYSGMLGGLVAISAGAGLVHAIGAVIIGAIAGLLVPLAIVLLDTRWHLDDPAGVVAIHGVGGAVGTLLIGVCAAGSVSSRLKQLGIQAIGVIAIGALVLVLAFVLFRVLRAVFVLRSKEADEYDGLDLAELDLNAYPDFHQTMIKSYHLREA